MTQIEHHTQAPTLEQRMKAWGEQFGQKRSEVNSLYQAAAAFYMEWVANGSAGDFSGTFAQHAGLSRTTAWRAYRAGMALKHGANPDSDQADLLEAARAFDGGATVEEVNQAIQTDTVKDLANKLSLGTVGRQMDVEVAALREQVLERLGRLGMDGLKPKDREALVYRAFIVASDETVQAVIEAHRALTEG